MRVYENCRFSAISSRIEITFQSLGTDFLQLILDLVFQFIECWSFAKSFGLFGVEQQSHLLSSRNDSYSLCKGRLFFDIQKEQSGCFVQYPVFGEFLGAIPPLRLTLGLSTGPLKWRKDPRHRMEARCRTAERIHRERRCCSWILQSIWGWQFPLRSLACHLDARIIQSCVE